ncbi:MAG TPA: response regulator [Candidatus Acidoferrum sp.]|jgi:phosphoribosyl 1,2-cyclic phosphodiesterase/CheY-like chemotaxis protein|nr:response regulator [Candidatus Acidoferrum sp.]
MRTVLVIDDEREFRTLLAELLRQNGWQVFEADDGEQGIQSAQLNLPDVVLCDLLMAPCNGFQVCRALRDVEALKGTKIVIASGRDFEADRQEALEAGAHEYLAKPIQLEQLLRLLSHLTATPEPTSPPPAPATSEAPTSVRLKFWGVRGSVPTPGPSTLEYGGNTSCLELRAGRQIVILDAGTGLRLLGRELQTEFGDQALDLTLLLTHTHWDHIQGLPFFLPVYKSQNRVRILGYEGARLGLETVLSSQMENPFFPIGLREVPANVRVEELKQLNFSLGNFQVHACFAYHPGVCVGYRLTAAGRSVAFFPDNEIRQTNRGAETPAAADFARAENQKLTDFLRHVDVLVMDAQYDRQEYSDHIGWGHGCVDEVVALALQAEVKHLVLFHHDPDHDDAKVSQMADHARQLVAAQKSALKVDAAREGMVVELPAVVPAK